MQISNGFGFHEEVRATEKGHGLRGHVSISRINKETGEKTLWYENDNIIDISGYQFILMKMFGLYLDSKHGIAHEDISKDTTVAIPDLNDSEENHGLAIGTKISEYTLMQDDIAPEHFIRGFMVGNGGSAEDGISSKNTDYAFTHLRNPIPFQQTNTDLSKEIANKYLGLYHGNNLETIGNTDLAKSYFLKKFDKRPKIYHGYWTNGQAWDTKNPISVGDLGPSNTSLSNPTANRIETYCECTMSLDENDCLAYFNNSGAVGSPVINELGLAAWDPKAGTSTAMEVLYESSVKNFIWIAFNNNRTAEDEETFEDLAAIIKDFYENTDITITEADNPELYGFFELVNSITSSGVDYDTIQNALSDTANNIGVEAFYNQRGELGYTEDAFLAHVKDIANITYDEAQRIKMITYYTFNAIPLSDNYTIEINYRIYAN